MECRGCQPKSCGNLSEVKSAHLRGRGVEVEWRTELVGFDQAVTGADLVITGEGSLDAQSLRGKAPYGVARAAAVNLWHGWHSVHGLRLKATP